MKKKAVLTSIAIICMMAALQLKANNTQLTGAHKPHPTVHVILLGDSNTWIGGDECDKPRGWNKWFKEFFQPASCKSYARSGATWTNTKTTKKNPQENIGSLGNDNVIYNQVIRLTDAFNEGTQPLPDIIIIGAGTNDLWFRAKRPGLYTMGADQTMEIPVSDLIAKPVNQVLSLTESIRYNCELLRQTFPHARIIILSPMQTTKVPTQDVHICGDVMQTMAEKLGIDIIRMDAPEFIDRKVEEKKFTNTYDGVHTSEAGARNNATRLNEAVLQLLDNIE